MRAPYPLLMALLAVVLLSGCGHKLLAKHEAFPQMYKEKPLAILALPPINESTAAEARDYYATTIAEPLSMCGYYVFPLEVTSEVLAAEGFHDTEAMTAIPLQKFREHFGADAVLYSTIREWDTNYYVIGGNVTVSAEFVLKSTDTGEELWRYDGRVVVDTSDNSGGGGLVGLGIKLIATAIKTATTDYVPVARQVNGIALYTLPYGRYHQSHAKDGDMVVVDETRSRKKS